jgi:hypothetical protein
MKGKTIIACSFNGKPQSPAAAVVTQAPAAAVAMGRSNSLAT